MFYKEYPYIIEQDTFPFISSIRLSLSTFQIHQSSEGISCFSFSQGLLLEKERRPLRFPQRSRFLRPFPRGRWTLNVGLFVCR